MVYGIFINFIINKLQEPVLISFPLCFYKNSLKQAYLLKKGSFKMYNTDFLIERTF